ncbi:PREDICTED: leucine-rich repeat-containing protein 59 isoform X1 [Rhagoletis zephyria]|uniref:leucine-rich repeat-containing protein 59 isoform X1 n=1 Tax=Rhagoletis zephyria TaxID=28612 RepID=UPI0008119C59|nr:PREDICTED: leucine-rich repeat-containing protein 59 isoform X1 [Rhagoletis zephyria]XP_036339986.1 leucine-rich repeat-containing protein 59 isoform X3 [Rhagoletis pomonella]XP_036339987.1 leucine-rich repeat-containing protein 59 isoform X4 [Rhagoletis pomonella]
MPKIEKVKVNVKERVDDNVCDLSLSGISEIPVREIASFKRVSVLDLSSNCITSLGKSFLTLIRLVKLDLSKNQIRYLPEEFGLLRNLRHLDLYDNKLEHLPLSFGYLTNLRYLDLKGNPLTPALAKVVGFCLTTKECQDSAKNTVKFLARMQAEAEKAKQQFQLQALNTTAAFSDYISTEEKPLENQKSKKSAKKAKSKSKKSTAHNNNNDISHEVNIAPVNVNNKTTKSRKNANGPTKKSISKSSTALTTVFTFFMLLAINVLIIYIIMFKNPEIADKLVETIPHQYRDWILTKTEIFRLRVTDWISEFRTPPQEH